MDLWHILGLAMVLYFVVFSIVDSRRLRNADAPETEPVTAPPASTPVTRRAESLARDLIGRMKERDLGRLLLSDYRFTARITRQDMSGPEEIRNRLNGMLQEMIRYLGLPPGYTVEVIPDESMALAPDRAAECDFARRRINFYLRRSQEPEFLTLLLCHECAHYFCFHHGMYDYRHKQLNEWNTDTVACLMGFSKYMLACSSGHYLKPAQFAAVRWTLLQERKALSGGQASPAA